MVRFSVDSIDYFADKSCQCRELSDESLSYLTEQISQIIFNLLEDASKVLRKCHRKLMTTDDFRIALKLRHLIPTYGNYISSSMDQCIFRKIRKDNRVLHQIEDEIVQFDELMTQQPKLPIDLSIRTHWLAIDGEQPLISENPIFESSAKSNSTSHSKKKSKKNDSRLHILHLEQQIYFKQMTDLCLCNDYEKRKQVLSILCSDLCLQQIIGQLILFIAEGIRVNIVMNCDRSMVLNNLLEMSDALLQNNSLNIEPYLHVFYPSILSCLLEQRFTVEHWTRRDLAGKCSVQIIRQYSTAANRLQQRTIEIFYRILIAPDEQYPWSTIYGALIGLCQMGHKVMIQIVFPLIKRIGERIQSLIDEEENDGNEISQRITETVVKYVLMTFRSIANDYEMNEKELIDDFGSYFAPLIQHELILLL